MEYIRKEFKHGFRIEDCNRCGICLAKCQYAARTPAEGHRLIKELVSGQIRHDVLSDCLRCGNCDYRCPNDARPSELMRECLEQKRLNEKALPKSMVYAVNGMGSEGWDPGFFQDVYRGLGKAERKILNTWAEPKKSKDLMWIGCTDRMMPRTIEYASVFRNVAKFGGPDDCCGAWAIQGGMLDEGYRIAERLVSRIESNSFDRLIVVCGHCQKILTKTLPEKLGIELPVPVISVYDFLIELIDEGLAGVTNPLNIEAAISDPCFASVNGIDFMGSIRQLAEKIGITVSEMPSNGETSLCCGYGGLFTDGKVSGVIRAAGIKRKDMKMSGKKHIVSYCPGCHLINHYFQFGYRSHYLLEAILSALGEKGGTSYSVFYRRMLRPHIAMKIAGLAGSALK